MELKAKRYYSKIAGAKYIMPDGAELVFHGGRFDFDPKKYEGEIFNPAVMNNQQDKRAGKPLAEVYQGELEHLVNTGNPLIFDAGHAVAVMSEKLPAQLDPTKNAHSEANVIQADARLANAAGANGVLTGDLNVGATGVTDVNANTADPVLSAMFAKATGPGADRLKALRDAAAHRVAATTDGGSSSNS